MSSGEKTSSGGGFFSTLIIVVLLALAIALYLKVVTENTGGSFPGLFTEDAVEDAAPVAASVQVVEKAGDTATGAPASAVPAIAAAPEPAPAASEPEGTEDTEELAALPADQMALIEQVFGSQ